MEQEIPFDPLDFVRTLWRTKWISILIFIIVFTIGIFAIINIPAVYRSTGHILVEQQEIPTEWVHSTVVSFADERIQAIGQRVLTTENLAKIIDKFNLYADERDTVHIDFLVGKVKQNFTLESAQASVRDRQTGTRNSATVSFQVSFDHHVAEVARDVATELVSLYLAENVKSVLKRLWIRGNFWNLKPTGWN